MGGSATGSLPGFEAVEAAEARLSQARYVLEVALIPEPEDGGGGPLALVVADREALRRDGVLDVHGFARFYTRVESAALARHQRPARFAILPRPLPRTPDGRLIREQLDAVLGGAPPRSDDPAANSRKDLLGEDPAARAVKATLERLAPHRGPISTEDELALDLGIDSLDRLVLVEDLQQRLGVPLPEEAVLSVRVADLLGRAREALTKNAQAAPHSPLSISGPSQRLFDEAVRVSRRRTWLRRLFFGAVRRLLRWRLEITVRGLENLPQQGPLILCPNHQTNIDGLLLMAVMPDTISSRIWILGKAQLFTRPIVSRLFFTIRLVPTDNKANFVPALHYGRLALMRGDALCIFPEGQRAFDERLGDWQPGAGVLAALTGAPIVPMALVGMDGVLAPGEKMPSFRDSRKRARKVFVSFGKPIHVRAPQGGMAELAATARDAVAELRLAVEEELRSFPESVRPLGL